MINSKSRSHNILITNITNGFTIVELLVVIAIIGILSTIGVVSFSSIQSNARNTQRSSKITILSEALEKYYDKNGEYPSCAAMTAGSSTVTTTTLKGLDPDVLTAPNAIKGANSITCSDIASPDTFAYLGGVTQYTLKYKEEDSSNIPILDSRRHVATTTYTLTITAGTGGTVNAGGTYNDGTTQTITATPSTYYSFSSWTGSTGCSGLVSHTITMDANKTCTANFTPTAIAAPSAPTVTPSTAGGTTTWSWGAASCPGNTARYQYRYTNTSGYNSGLIATASTSVAFTTSTEGKTYTVATQAECYNTATSSGMSAAGSAGYYRPITTIWGCTDPGANNYNPSASANDGSCTYTVWGCTDSGANNYNSNANANDGSCTYWIYAHYNPVLVNSIDQGGTYQYDGAQGACNPIGGRIPNKQELLAIYADRASYGNNFQAYIYWSSTEYSSSDAYVVDFRDGNAFNFIKTNYYVYVRCVKG